MTVQQKPHNPKEYIRELISLIVVACITVIAIIRGAEIGYLWRGFWGSILGLIAGCIIGFFACVGIIATLFFIIRLFLNLKKEKQKESSE
ncbi:MAG: hypothetical protein ACYTE1_09675 [Planctomycetota bacterium]|jgi:uncharacterized membrane protein